MGAIVDFMYYSTVYMGTEADQASFPALNAHASRVVASMTRWQVTPENLEQFPSLVQTLYKLAICSQIDFLAINGVESINSGDDMGFSIGKVRVDGKARSSAGGAMSASISPATISYLEQSGLMNPGVPVVGCCVC
jgi:hypothetical protein